VAAKFDAYNTLIDEYLVDILSFFMATNDHKVRILQHSRVVSFKQVFISYIFIKELLL